MKLNIVESKSKGRLKWYTWGEKCDRCGVEYLKGVHSTERPNTEECDFCVECYRYFFDNNIKYSEAYELYKAN